jgi:phage tail P2-like protein
MIELKDVSFADLLAPSIADDPTIRAMVAPLDQEFREVTEVIDSIILLPELDKITDPTLVDLLAWQMHVDFYDPRLSLEQRKRLIHESIPWHVRKGTVGMLQEVLDTFFEPGAATIQEWFQYKIPLPPNYPEDGWHDRYRFRIVADQDVIDSEAQAQAEALILAYKPVSRWPEATIRARRSDCQIYVGIGCLPWKYIPIEAPSL